MITQGVCRSRHGRARPLAFLRAVQEGLRLALDADPCYAGVLTKNPLHPAWRTMHPSKMPCYSLADLAATVDLRSARTLKVLSARMQPPVNLAEVGVGSRNRALFDVVRHWARRNHDNLTCTLDYAERCNAQLSQPLEANEVRDIATSIERYMTDPRRTNGTDKAFRARQADRGKLGGRPETTLSSQPWVAAGVCRSTWYRWQQSENVHQPPPPRKIGRPSTTKDHQPWLAAGVSRATWYRQQKAAATIGDA